MKRLLYLAALEAMFCSSMSAQKTVSGTVHDSSGALLCDVTVTERDADNFIVSYTRTDPFGAFQLVMTDPSHDLCFDAYPYEQSRQKARRRTIVEMKTDIPSAYSFATPVREYGKPAPIDMSVFEGLSGIASVTVVDRMADDRHVTVDGINYLLDGNGGASVSYNFSNTVRGDIVIPDSITYKSDRYVVRAIDNMAFWGCSDMKSVSVPATVTGIGPCAFGSCSSLETVLLPCSLTAIEPCTFYECRNLTEIVIPESVLSVGDFAFSRCPMKTVTLNSAKPIACPENAFDVPVYFEAVLNVPPAWKSDENSGSAWVQFRH